MIPVYGDTCLYGCTSTPNKLYLIKDEGEKNVKMDKRPDDDQPQIRKISGNASHDEDVMKGSGKAPAIDCDRYSFCYAGSDQPVLKACSFRLEFGEFMLLSGFSGEGKSTLLSSINGAVPHYISGEQTGDILLNSQSVIGMSMAQRARLAGSVLQNADHQIVHATVEDEIAFGCENLSFSPEQIKQKIKSVCEQFLLDPSWPTKTLSGGQKQRLMMASTLAMDQKILIFDEPLANIDIKGAKRLLRILKQLTVQGYAVLLIEHRLDVVMPYADKTAWLEDGHLEVFDQPADILIRRAKAASALHRKAFPDQPTELSDVLYGGQSAENVKKTENVKRDETVKYDDKFRSDESEKSSEEALFHLRHLCYEAGRRRIINNVSLSIWRGDRIVLLGDNGSGKTTLLQLLAYLVRPTGGDIVQTVLNRKAGRSPKWFRRVGYVYQDPSYQLFMPSVAEEIGYQSSDSQRSKRFMEQYNLEDFASVHPQILSEGQKRRVSIAAIHAANPEILLLDEPTVGQDTKHLAMLIHTLGSWLDQEQGTIVFITHDYRFAAALADRAIWIDEGRIVMAGGRDVIDAYFTQK